MTCDGKLSVINCLQIKREKINIMIGKIGLGCDRKLSNVKLELHVKYLGTKICVRNYVALITNYFVTVMNDRPIIRTNLTKHLRALL